MKINLDTAEELAKQFRVNNGFSLTEPISLKSLLRKLNILTAFRPLSGDFCGMSLKSYSGLMFILINENQTRGRQRFTIAHELYHLFYDNNPQPSICQLNSKDKSEANADLFASALILPENGIRSFLSTEEILHKKVKLATVIKIEQYYSSSRSALLNRLKSLRIISQAQYEALSQISVIESAKQYGYDTSLYRSCNKGLVIGDFGEKARLLFEDEKISEGHYNELLSLISDEED